MHSIFILVEPPDDFARGAGWHGYKALIVQDTNKLGWPEPEACGPFGWPHVEAFSLCYDVDDSIDHIAETIAKLRSQFQIGDVLIDDGGEINRSPHQRQG